MARELSKWTQARRAFGRYVSVTSGSTAFHGRLICVTRKEITVENRLGVKRRLPLDQIERITAVREDLVPKGRNR